MCKLRGERILMVSLHKNTKSFFGLFVIGLLLANFGAVDFIHSANAEGDWWNTNWSYRKVLTVNHTKVSGDLTSFPVLVNVTDSDLSSKAQSDGRDIAFTDNFGVKLNHEIEKYTSGTGYLVAWVAANISASSDTTIFMYYGNSLAPNQQNKTGVWDSNYKMVQHLSETSGTHYDSTANGYNATPNGGVIQGTSGKIDGADSFTGSQYLTVGNVNATGDWTVSFWEKSSEISALVYYPIGLAGNKGIGVGGSYKPDLNNDFYLFDGTNPSIHGGPSVVVGTWYYDTVVKNGTTYTIYVDGVSRVNGTLLDIDITNLRIGQRSDSLFGVKGIIDEVRLSVLPRSSAWISTEYNNQNSPSAFITVGSEELSGPPIPIISNPFPSDAATSVGLNPTLSIHVVDPSGFKMNITFMTNSSGSWQIIGSKTNVDNGTHTQETTQFDEYDRQYWWNVNVSDGTYSTNQTYSFTTTKSPGLWWNLDWIYRKSIIIDHTKVSASLSGFPVLIDISDPDIASKAQASGYDIVFTDYGRNKLNHEIESYNSSTGQLIAWVRANLTSTVDTILYMYYGNAAAVDQQDRTGVWESNEKMVQHLKETSGTQYDSTMYGNNGAPSGGVGQGIVGKIDGADSFDGVNDVVNCGTGSSLQITGNLTIEAWIKINTSTKLMIYLSKWANSHNAYKMGILSGGNVYLDVSGVGTTDEYRTSATALSIGEWHHVVGTYVSGASPELHIYIDGKLDDGSLTGTVPSSLYSSTEPLRIGGDSGIDNSRCFYGSVDEIRISDISRSAGWINASYQNQNSPSAFYKVGNEEIGEKPTSLSMIPPSQTCRKYGETFMIKLNVSEASDIENFEFEIHYNTTLLDYSTITWNAWGSGLINTDEANGIINGSTSGDPLSGNQTLISLEFRAVFIHIWKDESTVLGWKNNQSDIIYCQWANLSYPGNPDLGYVRGGLDQISVGPDFVYVFSPIRGDVDNNGLVEVFDLRSVGAYFNQENATYDLTGDGTIDIFDLVVVATNYGYNYPS